MQAFIEENRAFVGGLLASVGHKGRIDSVHFAIGWMYVGAKPHLKNRYVLAVAEDKNKGQWDFPGGKNDSVSPDPVVQFLTTAYKELYEELAVTVTVPLETFVLEIVQCGKSGRNLLVVCGIKGLRADRFRAEMQHKQSIRPRLPHQFLEMIDFRYLAKDDMHTLAHSTSYVRSQHARALHIVKAHCGEFPEFDAVMRIGVRRHGAL
jgi:8-oxo-dGTP pyrophosphatase MutT (NUDIX family)